MYLLRIGDKVLLHADRFDQLNRNYGMYRPALPDRLNYLVN